MQLTAAFFCLNFMNKKLVIAFAFIPYFGHAHGDTTWAEHIAPILYNDCTSSHHPGGLAPFSLMECTDAYNYKQSINVSTQSKKMPPWPPDANHSKFAHECVLTAQQISAIKDWVADGAPQGDILKAPKQPTYSGVGFLHNADLTLTIPTYSVKSSTDEYRYFAIPSGLLAANYISQMEVLPGNSGIVHHVLVF